MASTYDVPGSIEAIYEMAGYVVVEYTTDQTTAYALYVDQEPVGDFEDVDVALMYGVLYRYESEDALPWVAAMIGMEVDE